MRAWSGEFGREYTQRNDWSLAKFRTWMRGYNGWDALDLYAWLLDGVPRSIPVLEVGCNVGMQLECLAAIGFADLHGVELQQDAAARARDRLPDAAIHTGSALDLPFENDRFGLVFTSGLLIHISPPDLDRVLDEIHRTTTMYVMGIEYYAPSPCEVPYRGESGMLWKDDFERRYLSRFSELQRVRSRRLKLKQDPTLEDVFFLLSR